VVDAIGQVDEACKAGYDVGPFKVRWKPVSGLVYHSLQALTQFTKH